MSHVQTGYLPVMTELQLLLAQLAVITSFTFSGYTGKGLLPTLLIGPAIDTVSSLVGRSGNQPTCLPLASLP